MEIAILSGDPLFISAATAIAGAMGHTVTKVAAAAKTTTICDVATMESADLLDGLDPVRAVLFVLRESGTHPAFLHVYPRTSLAVELPKALGLLADASAVG